MSVLPQTLGVVVTNLDGRLVAMVNGLHPSPSLIVHSGDSSVMGSRSFGADPNVDACVAELQFAKEALLSLSNAPLVNLPGNHDTYGTEGDSPILWSSVFTNIPPYQRLEVNGLTIFCLYGHNGGYLDPPQEAWFRSEVASLSKTQDVAVFVHQPPFGRIAIERGISRPLAEAFEDWEKPIWVFAGHDHRLVTSRWRVGHSNLLQTSVSSANGLISKASDPTDPFTAGFLVIGLTNSEIVCAVFGALTNATYYAVSIPTNPIAPPFIFDDVTTPLLLLEEGEYDRSEFSEACKSTTSSFKGRDTGSWWAYVDTWRVKLPLSDYSGLATHALVAIPNAQPDSTELADTPLQDVGFVVGTNTNEWLPAEFSWCSNQTVWISIPEGLRTNDSLWFGATNRGALEWHVGGWGLATTNAGAWPLPPRLEEVFFNQPDRIALSIVATPRFVCRIESSTNFIDWRTNALVDCKSGRIHWEQPIDNGTEQLFFRVVESPGE